MSTFTPSVQSATDKDKDKKNNDDVVLTPSPPKDADSQLGPSFDAKVGLKPGSDETFRDVHRREVRELTPSVRNRHKERAKEVVARKMAMKDRVLALGLRPSEVTQKAEDAGMSLGAYLTQQENMARTGLTPSQQLVDRKIDLGRYAEDQRTVRTRAEQDGQNQRQVVGQQFQGQQADLDRSLERDLTGQRLGSAERIAEDQNRTRLIASRDDAEAAALRAEASRRRTDPITQAIETKQRQYDALAGIIQRNPETRSEYNPVMSRLRSEIDALGQLPESNGLVPSAPVNAEPALSPAGSEQGQPSLMPPVPTVQTDEQFDALPSGALFVGADGFTRRKP